MVESGILRWEDAFMCGRQRCVSSVIGGLLALRYIAESLDELSDMVATLFSPIPNRGKEPLHLISEHPFGPNEMGVSGMTLYNCDGLISPLDPCLGTDSDVVTCS